ncbi:hypothetical protein VCRA2113O415_100058 [Vibrio crassostreae]|nr:hypothetical protein VCRA2113O415_100058 [Vibrio crassostreae]CAK2935674.1 hypothetical protein VCRA2113O420_50142 [Vibrio crassostreae]CAK3542141.1 hypothetical protein VCRA2121O436_50107 [Vibrio crassostreae]
MGQFTSENTSCYNENTVVDKAFDLGFISFDDHGKVLISSYLESPDVIGLKEDMAFSIMPDHRPYLRYHRGELFKGR